MSQLLSSEEKIIHIDLILSYLFRQSDESVVAYGAFRHSELWGKEKQQGERIVLEMSMRNSRLDCPDILLFPRVVLGANTLLNSQRYDTHTHTQDKEEFRTQAHQFSLFFSQGSSSHSCLCHTVQKVFSVHACVYMCAVLYQNANFAQVYAFSPEQVSACLTRLIKSIME